MINVMDKEASMDTEHLQYSQTGQTVLLGQDKPSGDTVIKKLFSNRHVVAWLLRECTREYKDVPLEEICGQYLPRADVTFGEIPVHAGDIPPTVPAAGTEDRKLREGTTVYDVLFKLPVPDRPGQAIGIIVNLEVQNDDNPGYEIVTRMIYYQTRILSGEHDEIFTRGDYGRICKVYSLWFVPCYTGETEPSVLRYTMNEDVVLGPDSRRAPKEAYDLLEGLICRFSSDQYTSNNPLIHYLQLLLTNIDTPEKRLDELQRNYSIPKTQEAESMCNYTFVLEEKGFKNGREKGREEGREEGMEEGMEKGMEKGRIITKLKILQNLEQKHYEEKLEMELLQITPEELQALKCMLYSGQYIVA